MCPNVCPTIMVRVFWIKIEKFGGRVDVKNCDFQFHCEISLRLFNYISKMKKQLTNDLIPGDIFHPGEFVKDEMEARKMTQQELADKMHISKSEMSLLLNGHRNITPIIAIKLEKALGIDAEF